ncbi:MAG: VWA domain-containing protein [Spirochaetes bacterium]|nr:VWA domain-containing protein [Spirochaetota bacterium]
MKGIINFLIFLALIITLIISKYCFYLFNLQYFLISLAFETSSVFVFLFFYSLGFDRSKNSFQEKCKINITLSAIFIAAFFFIHIIKYIFISNQVLLGIINYLLFGLLGSLPFIRNKFFYSENSLKEFILDISLIIYFILSKFIFNIISFQFQDVKEPDMLKAQILFAVVFVVILYSMKSIIYSIFVRGSIEFDGNNYPIFDVFKVGKNKGSDIVIDDKEAMKSTFFTILTNKFKWVVKPGFPINIDNKNIEQKSEIDEGETINCRRNYFTISKNRGNFIKRFLTFFFFILTAVFQISGEEIEVNDFLYSDQIQIDNVDFSNHPNLDLYITDKEIFTDLKNNIEPNKKNIFIVEGEDWEISQKTVTLKDRGLDLVLVLDITGSMLDEYKKIKKDILDFSKNIKNERPEFRIGIITFADLLDDIAIYPLSYDYEDTISKIDRFNPQSGGDYKENPYDALIKAREMKFNPSSQKVIILITDAPPHIKGDKANKGFDFTTYKTDDIAKIFNTSSYLLYIASHERFEEYQTIVGARKNKFYNLDKYDNLSEIFHSLEKSLKNQIKLTFVSKFNKNFYERQTNRERLVVYKDVDAKKAKSFFNKKRLKRISFINSLFDNF